MSKDTTQQPIAGFDNLWATISDTHGRWDEGEIDNATAKAECDAAVADYLGNAPEKEDTSHMMETPLQGTINVHEAFVTMTVPVSIAMRVADYELKEMGDSHLSACENVEQMLVQDLEEEYGIDRDMAMKYHERVGYYGEGSSCEKCGVFVPVREYCGNDKPNGETEYLCPDCYVPKKEVK